jgi:hypothetical protein
MDILADLHTPAAVPGWIGALPVSISAGGPKCTASSRCPHAVTAVIGAHFDSYLLTCSTIEQKSLLPLVSLLNLTGIALAFRVSCVPGFRESVVCT